MSETSIYNIPEMRKIVLNKKIIRKCSFCKCEGHNVSTCDNIALSLYLNYLKELKNNILESNQNNMVMSIKSLESFIYNFCGEHEDNCKLIKAIASRYCHTKIRSYLQVSVNRILFYLFEIDSSAFALHEYNTIPFSGFTPVRLGVIIDGIILNYMANENLNSEEEMANLKHFNCEITLGEMSVSSDTEIECSICYSTTSKIETAKLECSHEFCIDCTNQFVEKKFTNCPYCRTDLKKINCYKEENYNKLVMTAKNYYRVVPKT